MNIRLFKTFTLKINGFVFLFSLLVFAILIKLGFWQLDRATEKDLRLQKMTLYQQQEALDLNDILDLIAQREDEKIDNQQTDSKQTDREALNDLPVSLSGKFNNKQSFLLDNQIYKGSLGYRVIKVFQDEKTKATVLVNLGWIQGGIDRNFIPEIADIQGKVTFRGKIRVLESPILLVDEVLQVNTWPQRIQSIDINKISMLLEQPLLPFIVYVDNDDPLGYIKEWVPIVMPPEKHRGYAFQWFTLALAWLILMLTAAYKAANTNNEQNSKE
tara:strand:- start:2957 stop:3772 length:816 start_codon:yes stop_codon:yes gene_type:complete